jgi:glycine betaine/proline transport system permease protein
MSDLLSPSTAATDVALEKSRAQLGPEIDRAAAAPAAPRRRLPMGAAGLTLLAALVIWLIARFAFDNRWTLALDPQELTTIHDNLNTWPEWVTQNQNVNPFFIYFVNHVQILLQTVSDFVSEVFYQTQTGLGIPYIGWLGTTVLVTWIAYAVGNVKVAVLTAAVFLLFVLQGLWADAMASFAQVITAVLFAFVIGVPLGVWAGVSDRASRIITPVLDFMQIMPAFAYLAPLVLIFSLGSASVTAAVFIFAVPPIIRLTSHGIRQVPLTTREAVDSLGVTSGQRLRHVLLPMSKRTTVIGVNQTFMAALSMVVIAAYIAAPGLGSDVQQALQSLDVGTAFNAGLSIVLMAIVFDRVSTAASVRSELAVRKGTGTQRRHWIITLAGLAVAVVAVLLSRSYLWAAQPPVNWPNWGANITSVVNTASTWTQSHLSLLTLNFKDAIAYGLLNPLQSLLVQTPWFVVGLVFVVIGYVVGGWKIAAVMAGGVAALVVLGVWSDSMFTLASTILASIAAIVFGLVIGVWMGRSKAADRVIRPILDGAQTMPAFVYLVPFLGLFGPGRVTAIFAGIIYAAPAAIKIVADGIRQVPENTVESAISSGSTTWQLITKVQVPMSIKSIALASNQAVIYTLSMVVIGAAVGGGGLGYLVISGLQNPQYFGKGLAAGLALVVLGIMVDRVTQAAAQRSGQRARAATETVAPQAPISTAKVLDPAVA